MIKVSNFPNAYKEVYIILRCMDKKDFDSIPKGFVNMLELNMNKDYEFEYDSNIEFENQNLLRETKAIFAYIFLHFWGNDKQKNAIMAKFKQDKVKEEEEKKLKYPVDNIFRTNANTQTVQNKDMQMIEVKKESIVTRIVNKIKRWIKH